MVDEPNCDLIMDLRVLCAINGNWEKQDRLITVKLNLMHLKKRPPLSFSN